MAIAAGISILSSFAIFPESVGHAFRTKFTGVLQPLSASLISVEELFQQAKDHDHEVDDARWIPLEDARTRLSYPGEREMIERALSILAATGLST